MQQRHRSRSKRHRTHRDSGILRGEFDANLRRFDERMNRMFAKSDERAAQHRKECDERAAQHRKECEKRDEQRRLEREKRDEQHRQECEKRDEQRRLEREKRDEEFRKECKERSEQFKRECEARSEQFKRESERNRKEAERRTEESNRRADELLKAMDQRMTIDLNNFREMMDVNMRRMDTRIDDMKQHFTAQVTAIREDVVEIRKESKLLRWNIWIAACTTVLGVAGAMSAMNSVIISAFESGRSASVASARHAGAPATLTNVSPDRPGAQDTSADVSTHTPHHRREDAPDTLEDNHSQS
ncbi:hypothetical protein [Cupriavidus sp. D384]|uniref:hypothetical protein n=1 Tax=Cupriavidus sp. D384 TaxID=1538095 RepID=UPI000830090B|nr:hypothetical protein [Cupriavidus sp. D384]